MYMSKELCEVQRNKHKYAYSFKSTTNEFVMYSSMSNKRTSMGLGRRLLALIINVHADY